MNRRSDSASDEASTSLVFVRRKAPRSVALDKSLVRAAAGHMLAALDLHRSELSVLLCDASTMRKLNREHRGIDKDTDVLSFPQNEFETPLVPVRGSDLSLLGDVIISLDKARSQARGRGRPLEDEVLFLLAHGLLHLLGFDHDEPEKKKEMTRMTKKLVRATARSGEHLLR